jgi:multidrug transporter EmrE-like cation transporter
LLINSAVRAKSGVESTVGRWGRAAWEDDVSASKLLGLALIVVGVLGLVYGSFSYTKETHEAKLGPLEMSVKEKETVSVPVWAGVGAIAVGTVLLLTGKRKG